MTNEPVVANRHLDPIGAMVWMPSVFLEPGVIECHCSPRGYFVLGCWPGSELPISAELEHVAHTLTEAGFACRTVPDVRRFKLGKLLLNLGNATDALCRPEQRASLVRRLQQEARRALAAARLEFVEPEELTAEANRHVSPVTLPRPRPGGSTWQSAVRRQPLETEHLNGYIADLARRHGIRAHANEAMVQWSHRFAADPTFEVRSLDPRAILDSCPRE